MASRLELHEELCTLLGSKNAYFQSPESVKMSYDAIRYALGGKSLRRANNRLYNSINEYDCVLITRNPDTTLPDKILNHFEMCSFGRPYVVDNLHHYPFTLYY